MRTGRTGFILKWPVSLVSVAVILVLAMPRAAYAQNPFDYLSQTGSPSFTSADSFPAGFVNISNGNLHIEIPIASYSERAGQVVTARYIYDSRGWTIENNGISRWWNLGGGWSYQVTGAPSQSPWRIIEYLHSTHNCGSLVNVPVTGPFEWDESNGTRHVFPIITDFMCSPSAPYQDAYALDGSGYHMFVFPISGNGNCACVEHVIGRDGVHDTMFVDNSGIVSVFPRSTIQSLARVDTNGNVVASTSQTQTFLFTDGMGTPIGKIVSAPVGGGNGPWETDRSFPNSKGTTSIVQEHRSQIDPTPAFGVPGVTDATASYTPITSLVLADGSAFTFTYDCSGPATLCTTTPGQTGSYGEVKSMTLPTGRTIYFNYSLFVDANGNVNRWLTSRQDGSGSWTYAPSTGCGSGCQTVTVARPSGDQQVYQFNLNQGNGAWATSVKYYTGAANGTPLMTVQNAFQSFATDPTLGNFAFTLPQSTTTTVSVPGGNLVKQTNYTYDTYTYTYLGATYTGSQGRLKTRSEYGFGNGSTGPLLQKTTISYLVDASGSPYVGANSSGSSSSAISIIDRITENQVQDGNGHQIQDTKMTYDSLSNQGLRGNVNTIQRWASSESGYRTTNISYDNYSDSGFPHSGFGEITQIQDSKGNQTSLGYSDAFFVDNGQNPPQSVTSLPSYAYPTSVMKPLIGKSSYGYYSGTGKLAVSIDENGADTYTHYLDNLDHKTHTYFPTDQNGNRSWLLTQYASPVLTQVDTFTSVTDLFPSASCSDCLHEETLLDSEGRLTSKILANDPEGATTVSISYDSSGRRQATTNPYRSISDPSYGTESVSAFDGLDRALSVTRADGSVALTSYGASVSSNGGRSSQLCASALGYPILTKDEAGNKRQTWTDALGRAIETDEPDSNNNLTVATCYSFSYDANGNLTRQVTQGSVVRTYVYDSLSRIISASNPESGLTAFSYTNSDGSLCSGDSDEICRRTDARNVTSMYAYDSLNRLISVSYSDSTPPVKYGYDGVAPNGCTPPSLIVTNGKGRRTSMCDGSGQTAWTYDPAGNIVAVAQTIAGVTKRFSYSYNLDGSIASITYPSGRIISYSINNIGRPTAAQDTANNVNYATLALYTPHGALRSLMNGANLLSTWYYNQRLQPCRMAVNSTGIAPSTCADSGHSGNVLDHVYDFHSGSTNNQNIYKWSNTITSGRNINYSYDTLSRISSASTDATTGANCWGETFTIDPLGNLTNIAGKTGYTGCTQESGLSISVNAKNHILDQNNSDTLYDAAGNMTRGLSQSFAYSYNAENQMIQATTNSVTGYVYDGDGRRVEKVSGGTAYKLYWYGIGSNPLVETDGGGNITDEYIFFNSKRIARRVGP